MLARFISWIKSETALATAETWEPPVYQPCSSEDPRCAETIRKLADCRERMRRMKAGLIDGSPDDRPYTRGADVEATFKRARAIVAGPVRAVPSRKAAR